MKIVIIANGAHSIVPGMPEIISAANYIIAADGGIIICHENNIEPDFLIGDLDSYKKKWFRLNAKTKIIRQTEQNSTDMEKALEFSKTLKPDIIDVFCSFGKRMDHTLGNIFILNNYYDLNIMMHDPFGIMYAINPGLKKFNDLQGCTVSLFAISPIKNIILNGFEFPIENKETEPAFIGVSNKIIKENASISFEKGRLIVYQVNKESDL